MQINRLRDEPDPEWNRVAEVRPGARIEQALLETAALAEPHIDGLIGIQRAADFHHAITRIRACGGLLKLGVLLIAGRNS